MKLVRRYIRSFAIGIILAALAFGSMSLKATHSPAMSCQEGNQPRCQESPEPIPMPDCSKRMPCPLEKAE